jgi:hypothetical protein
MGAGLSPIDATPRALSFLAYDIFQYFSWWIYLGAALSYSALVFTGELSKDGPLIFSRKNARSIPVIIGIHINFLIVLLLLMKLICSIDPSLPTWMTSNIGRGGTLAVVFFILGMVVMSFIERRWLYVESGAIIPDSDRTS